MKDDEEKLKKEGWNIEDGTENTCPICGSKRISQINTYQEWEEKNLSSGRILDTTYKGKTKNSIKSPFGRIFHNYLCRKCGWQSRTFDE